MVKKQGMLGSALGGFAMAGLLASCGAGGGEHNPAGSPEASNPGSSGSSGPSGSYEVSGANALDVRNRNGSVRISVGSGPMSVTENLRYGAVKPTTSHRVDAGTLKLVASGCGNSQPCEVDYEITVPASTPVTVTQDNGQVDVDGVAGMVDLTTHNGRLNGTALGARQVTLKIDNGAVTATFAVPPDNIEARAGTGAITLVLPGGATYNVLAHADVGMAQVDAPTDPSSQHRITATSGTGLVAVRTS
jgi:DUF4097 and DUF4098 domain-containing protein YvlB